MRKGLIILILMMAIAFKADAEGLFIQQPADTLRQATLQEVPIYLVDYNLLPVLGYSSDFGLFGGLLLQRHRLSDFPYPMVTVTELDLRASLDGNVLGDLTHERSMFFGREIHTTYHLRGVRHKESKFFGLGNDTQFSRSRFDDGYYGVEERSLHFGFDARIPMLEYGNYGRLTGVLTSNISYNQPVSRQDESVFAIEEPTGVDGGWVNQLGVGLRLVSKDDPLIPELGYHLEARWLTSQSWLASNYAFDHLKFELRGYLSPFSRLVVAQKVELQVASGNTPFWELPRLGHGEGLRGYALNRFRGERSILHILEIRSWIAQFYDGELRLGGQLFMDTGRVFAGGGESNRVFDELRQTFGIGGAVHLPASNFLLRADLGFSEEMTRIYVGLGYLF